MHKFASTLLAATLLAAARPAPAQSVDVPRLFVLGDSISMQYGPALERFVAGRFTYDRKRADVSGFPVPNAAKAPGGANGGDSAMVLAYLRARKATGGIPADILLLNCGLHDIKTDTVTGALQVDLPYYRGNLHAILAEARDMGLHVVWVNSTPVVDEIHNARQDEFHRFDRDVQAYNKAADEIMLAAGIPVIDLYRFTRNFLPEGVANHVHFSPEVQEKQGAFIAGALLALQQSGQFR